MDTLIYHQLHFPQAIEKLTGTPAWSWVRADFLRCICSPSRDRPPGSEGHPARAPTPGLLYVYYIVKLIVCVSVCL